MAHLTQEPRRVAFVLGGCGSGGTETQSQLLVRGLRARGLEVDVFLVEGAGMDARLDFGDAPVTALTGGRGRGVGGAASLCLAGARLGTALRRRHYDVVHAALARAYVVAPLTAPWRHRPRIVAWRRNLGIHLRQRWDLGAVDRMAAQLSDVIVTNSESVRQYWVSRGHVPAGRTRVIHNALEPWRFDQVPSRSISASTLRLVTVGGLRAVKGHSVLIDAAARLMRESIPVEVVILGDGPLRQPLCEQADRLGVPLSLPGHVDDTRPWLASASVYVHPSLSEGASNSVAEAMAQGCPILATDVGGTAEMLGSGGGLVAAGRAAALVGGLRKLYLDPGLCRELGMAARLRARALFDHETVIDQHLDVYTGG